MMDPWLNYVAHSPSHLISVFCTELENPLTREKEKMPREGLWSYDEHSAHCHKSTFLTNSKLTLRSHNALLISQTRLQLNCSIHDTLYTVESIWKLQEIFCKVSLISLLGLVTSNSTLGDQITNPHSNWQTLHVHRHLRRLNLPGKTQS